jgi:hypothetical protein
MAGSAAEMAGTMIEPRLKTSAGTIYDEYPLTFILKQPRALVYVVIGCCPTARNRRSFARPAIAAGGRAFFQRCKLLFVKGLRHRLALGIDTAQDLDLPLRALQQAVAGLEMFYTLLITGERIGQTELAALQFANDCFELA